MNSREQLPIKVSETNNVQKNGSTNYRFRTFRAQLVGYKETNIGGLFLPILST